jgi:hypothetical protein
VISIDLGPSSDTRSVNPGWGMVETMRNSPESMETMTSPHRLEMVCGVAGTGGGEGSTTSGGSTGGGGSTTSGGSTTAGGSTGGGGGFVGVASMAGAGSVGAGSVAGGTGASSTLASTPSSTGVGASVVDAIVSGGDWTSAASASGAAVAIVLDGTGGSVAAGEVASLVTLRVVGRLVADSAATLIPLPTSSVTAVALAASVRLRRARFIVGRNCSSVRRAPGAPVLVDSARRIWSSSKLTAAFRRCR